jgi:hypothetical protein
MATKFFTLAPNICGASVWDFIHVTLMALRILRRLIDFCKICAPTFLYYVQGGSNMTGTDYTLFTHKSVPVIFEPPCIIFLNMKDISSSNSPPERCLLSVSDAVAFSVQAYIYL